MNTQKSIMDFDQPMDYTQLMEYLNVISERYPFVGITGLGETIMGRTIPCITVGEGERSVLYVGGECATEWMTTVWLLRFLNEFCELYQNDGKAFHYSIKYLFSTRRIYILPMLNPDGIEYQIHGVPEDHILYDRLLAMNGGSNDFSTWQANARGVDLSCNYSSGFTSHKAQEAERGISNGAPYGFGGQMPESEPEIGSLCNFIRYHQNINAVVSLHTEGEKIFYTHGQKSAPRSQTVGSALSRVSGFHLVSPKENTENRGLTDWCIDELNIPAFSIACSKGAAPLGLGDWFRVYMRIREMLFMMPSMI